MGLNAKILKKYPELYRYTLKNYRYGGKHRLSLNSISNSNNTKRLKCRMIVFPKYKAYRNMSMRQLSKKDGLDRLTKENLTIYNKEIFPKLSVNNFEVLCNLIRQVDSFELTYNDNNLNKIAQDDKALAEGIMRLLEDVEFRNKLGKNGRKMVSQYDWEKIVEEYLEVYHKVLNRGLSWALL